MTRLLAISALLLSACNPSASDGGSDAPGGDTDSPPDGHSATADTAIISPTATTASTGDTSTLSDGPTLVASAVRRADATRVSLVNVLEVTTDVPAQVTVHLTDPEGDVRDIVFDDLAVAHELPILGLRFDTVYDIGLTLIDEQGGVSEIPSAGQTLADSPPQVWPTIDVLTADASQMEPGYTLFALNVFKSIDHSYLVVMDDEGKVVWLYKASGTALDARIDQSGNILCLLDNELVQIDFLGNELARYNPDGSRGGTPVDVLAFHHEANEMPNGNLLSLTDRIESHPNFPQNYNNPADTGPEDVLSHDIVEFDRSGAIVGEWHLWDLIDTDRIAYDSRNEDPKDWVHSNAVTYDPTDDSFLVSLRHQDALIKFSRATGELMWILAPHDNWSPEFQPYLLTPEPGTEWAFHPHGPMISPTTGRIVVFDNGNWRISPFDGNPYPDTVDQYSRLVEYEVDPKAMTVRQTWEFLAPGDEVLFSYATGDADYLPSTGNVLGTYGFTYVADGVENEDMGRGFGSSRLIEVNPTTNEVAFDVWMHAPISEVPDGWHGYRAVRFPSLYPLAE